MQMLRQKVAPIIGQQPGVEYSGSEKMANNFYTQPLAEQTSDSNEQTNMFESFMALYHQMQKQKPKSNSQDKQPVPA